MECVGLGLNGWKDITLIHYTTAKPKSFDVWLPLYHGFWWIMCFLYFSANKNISFCFMSRYNYLAAEFSKKHLMRLFLMLIWINEVVDNLCSATATVRLWLLHSMSNYIAHLNTISKSTKMVTFWQQKAFVWYTWITPNIPILTIVLVI